MPPPPVRRSQHQRSPRSARSTSFAAQFTFLNPAPHPSLALYQLYTEIAEARGLPPIVPLFVSNDVLRTIDNASVNTRGMRSSVFFLDFDQSAANWITANVPGNRRPHKQFTGGTIRARAVASIFIDDRARFKRKAIQKIMEHEMDHARDSKQSMNGEVLRYVRADQMVKDHLIERKPIEEGTWRHWFCRDQPSPYQQRLDSILAAARTVEPKLRLIDPPSSDSQVARRALDAFLFMRVWKPSEEKHGKLLHRDSAHLQTMSDVGSALDDPDDPELYREFHGRLPANVG